MPDPIMGPLKGVRVIEMGSLIAGPYAGALFAQFGAEVIKLNHQESVIRCANGERWMVIHHSGGIRESKQKSLTLNLKDADAQPSCAIWLRTPCPG